MKIAVVIPTYNEKDNIGKLISAIFALELPDLEIIVVDDNSPDGTGKIVEEIKTREPRVHALHQSKKKGLGRAYIAGFQYALEGEAEYIFEMDADFSHDPRMIPKFLKHAETHDLIIGSRYVGGVRVVNWPLRRLFLSVLANKYASFVTGLKIADATSGFKCYRRKVLESIDLQRVKSSGYSFQIEMKYRAHKKNFTLREIPIIFVDRTQGLSKISRNIVWEALFIVWKLRLGIIR